MPEQNCLRSKIPPPFRKREIQGFRGEMWSSALILENEELQALWAAKGDQK